MVVNDMPCTCCCHVMLGCRTIWCTVRSSSVGLPQVCLCVSECEKSCDYSNIALACSSTYNVNETTCCTV